MEVIIAIDDLHPEKGWGCEGDESIGYLEQLNQEKKLTANLNPKFNRLLDGFLFSTICTIASVTRPATIPNINLTLIGMYVIYNI